MAAKELSAAERYRRDRLFGDQQVLVSGQHKPSNQTGERLALLSAVWENATGGARETLHDPGTGRAIHPFLWPRRNDEGKPIREPLEVEVARLREKEAGGKVFDNASFDEAIKGREQAIVDQAVRNALVTEPAIQLAYKSGQRGGVAMAEALAGRGDLSVDVLQELAGANTKLEDIVTHLSDKLGIKHGEAAATGFQAKAAELLRSRDEKGLAELLAMAEEDVRKIVKPEPVTKIDAIQPEKRNVPIWEAAAPYAAGAGGAAASIALAQYLMGQGLQQSSYDDYAAAAQQQALAGISR